MPYSHTNPREYDPLEYNRLMAEARKQKITMEKSRMPLDRSDGTTFYVIPIERVHQYESSI